MNFELFVHEDTVIVPGQNLCKSSGKVKSGQGVYEEKGFIKAAKIGKVKVNHAPECVEISIESTKQAVDDHSGRSLQIKLGDVVLAKVRKLNETSAKVEILAINDKPVGHHFEGIIKRENMRKVNIDNIRVDEMCCPNDVVVCRVKSMNESKNILLTIEDDELGVVLSKSENFNILVPISRERMQSPVTKKAYPKKVACLVEKQPGNN